MPSTSSFTPYAPPDNEIANMLISTVNSSSNLQELDARSNSSFATPQRNKNQRPNPTPTSNVFSQQGPSTSKQDSVSPTNLEPSLQSSGSVRKRGSRGRKRNRGKSQTENDPGKDKEGPTAGNFNFFQSSIFSAAKARDIN